MTTLTSTIFLYCTWHSQWQGWIGRGFTTVVLITLDDHPVCLRLGLSGAQFTAVDSMCRFINRKPVMFLWCFNATFTIASFGQLEFCTISAIGWMIMLILLCVPAIWQANFESSIEFLSFSSNSLFFDGSFWPSSISPYSFGVGMWIL